MVTSSKVLALVLLRATADTEVTVPPAAAEVAALAKDDECLADAGSGACSESLRQLRGRSTSLLADRHNASTAEGFCCTAGTSTRDMCGTCYSAADGDCNTAERCAAHCGGEWCGPVCIMGFEKPDDVCGSAWPSAVASGQEFCGSSKYNCQVYCHGTWCMRHTKLRQAPAVKEATPKVKTANEAFWPYRMSSAGFCCYNSSDSADTCGTCYQMDDAEGDGTTCASSRECSGCGGTWCQARCVLSVKNRDKPCSTAYHDAVAKAGDYCSASKKHCSICKGHWCPAVGGINAMPHG